MADDRKTGFVDRNGKEILGGYVFEHDDYRGDVNLVDGEWVFRSITLDTSKGELVYGKNVSLKDCAHLGRVVLDHSRRLYIEEALNGAPLVTRDGKKVLEIYQFKSLKRINNIFAVVEGHHEALNYFPNGNLFQGDYCADVKLTGFDLFMEAT